MIRLRKQTWKVPTVFLKDLSKNFCLGSQLVTLNNSSCTSWIVMNWCNIWSYAPYTAKGNKKIMSVLASIFLLFNLLRPQFAYNQVKRYIMKRCLLWLQPRAQLKCCWPFGARRREGFWMPEKKKDIVTLKLCTNVSQQILFRYNRADSFFFIYDTSEYTAQKIYTNKVRTKWKRK